MVLVSRSSVVFIDIEVGGGFHRVGFEIYEDDYWEKSGKCDCMHFMKYFVKRVSLGSTLYDE